MAPKTSTGKVDLLSFRPTLEELERAREMLASSDVKVKASKVRAMLQFAKGNPGDTANRILASRGDERLDHVARYVAFQDKKKRASTASVSATSKNVALTQTSCPCANSSCAKNLATEKTDAWAEVWCASIPS